MGHGQIPGPESVLTISSDELVAQAPVPYIIDFTPTALVAVGALQTETHVHSYRNFVCTHIGVTGPTVGVPSHPSRFRVQVRDLNAGRNFQPHRWDATAVIGGNLGQSDSSAFELPVPWVFISKTTIEVTFENISTHPAIPSMVLIGYLDVDPRFRELLAEIMLART